jgi:hypothetical protein
MTFSTEGSDEVGKINARNHKYERVNAINLNRYTHLKGIPWLHGVDEDNYA